MLIDFLHSVVMGTAPDEEDLPSWAAGKAVNNLTAPVYLLRDATYAFTHTGDVDIPLTSAASDIISGVRSLSIDLVNGEIQETTVKKLVTAAGLTVGWPAGHFYRYTRRAVELFDPFAQ